MKALLAVAIAACALSGSSAAVEINLVESMSTRVLVMTESITFGAGGHDASAAMVLTRASDGDRHPMSMVAICRRNDGAARGIGLVSYQNDKTSDDGPGTSDGSKEFDSIARAQCGRTGLRALASAQP